MDLRGKTRLTTSQFIKNVIAKHGLRYDYSKVEYISNMAKVIITCSIHGDFHQSPAQHMRGSGCQKCANNKIGSNHRRSHDDFIKIANKANPNFTILSKYEVSGARILIKDQYDIKYLIESKRLLNKTKVSLSSAVDKTDAFIKKSNFIHDNRYSYSDSIYKNCTSIVKINCDLHGDFFQNGNLHLRGGGCPKCGKSGFSRSRWIEFCENKKNSNPIVYIIRFYNHKENFIKIGITTRSLKKRFGAKSQILYDYEVIREIKGSPGFVFDKEKELHRKMNKFKYTPLKEFGGKTECFLIDALSDPSLLSYS